MFQVYGVEGMSNQKIQMYFEHPKSKGGDVSDVELVQEHKCAVVIFEDYEGIFLVYSTVFAYGL